MPPLLRSARSRGIAVFSLSNQCLVQPPCGCPFQRLLVRGQGYRRCTDYSSRTAARESAATFIPAGSDEEGKCSIDGARPGIPTRALNFSPRLACERLFWTVVDYRLQKAPRLNSSLNSMLRVLPQNASELARFTLERCYQMIACPPFLKSYGITTSPASIITSPPVFVPLLEPCVFQSEATHSC
jgi:hypothetical protein